MEATDVTLKITQEKKAYRWEIEFLSYFSPIPFALAVFFDRLCLCPLNSLLQDCLFKQAAIVIELPLHL